MRDSSYFCHKLYFTLEKYKTTALKYRFKIIFTILNQTSDKRMHVIRIKLLLTLINFL